MQQNTFLCYTEVTRIMADVHILNDEREAVLMCLKHAVLFKE